MIGRVLSQYRVTAYLGKGAMGEVYKAEHTRLSLTVAIKFIPESLLGDAKAKQRFVRQAEALAALNHENICRFYEIGETTEGRTYIVMSHCGGETLQDHIASGECSIRDAIGIAIGIASGLAHAHDKGVIHRDLKPANLMFDKGVIKIVDFGLALLTDHSSLTSSDATVGTLMYTSPEQAEGELLDGRTDIFAVGSVVYELLTGKPPFQAEHPASILYKIVNQPHRPVRELRPDVPESLSHVVDRCLAKKPEQRYENADALLKDLEAVLTELEPERRTTSSYWIKRRRKRAVRVALAAATALVALGIWQRCWIIRTTGLGFCSGEPGIAVLPTDPVSGTAEDRALVAGFARDLNDRIRAHRNANPSVWTVDPARISRAGVRTPEKARALVGARLVIAAQVTADTNPLTIAVESYDVRSSATFKEKVEVPLGPSFDSNRIGADVRKLAGLKTVATADSGYTRSAEAYREYLIGLGHLAGDGSSLDDAIVALEQAVAVDTAFARARAVLGEAYRRRFESGRDTLWADLAGRTCREALASFRNQPNALVTLAQVYSTRGKPDAASHALVSALALDPRNRDAIWQLAAVYTANGEPHEAEAAYVRAVDTNRADPMTYEMLGYFYLTHGRYADAIAPFERQTRLTPEYGQAYNYLGSCYFAMDCWDGAFAMFTRSFDLARNFEACANLGTLYYMDNDFTTAAQMYQWAHEYFPASVDVVSALADCHYWIPDHREQAIALYHDGTGMAEARRQSRPNDAHVLAMLAGFYSIIEPDSVPSLTTQALAAGPDDPDVNYRVAVAYELTAQREKALKHLARALDLGQSVRQIDTEPFLAELRKDSRYNILRKGVKERAPDCPRVE
ncbi:MAG: protein kinase [Candidatus Krumholzibacteria bacterium]|nr:protein kinase [Candidatus Krumholzibacteria bacterium]